MRDSLKLKVINTISNSMDSSHRHNGKQKKKKAHKRVYNLLLQLLKYKTSTIMLIIIVKFEMIITIIKALETE